CVKLVAQCVVERDAREAAGADAETARVDLQQRRIDRIDARAGHQPDEAAHRNAGRRGRAGGSARYSKRARWTPSSCASRVRSISAWARKRFISALSSGVETGIVTFIGSTFSPPTMNS